MHKLVHRTVFTLSVALLGAGCGTAPPPHKSSSNKGEAPRAAPPPVAMPSPCSEDGKTADARQTDVNDDGKPDVVKYYGEATPGKGASLMRQDIDLNWDSKIDVCRHFAADGTTTKEQVDQDYDGKIDEVRFFEDGVIARSEVDRNNDGKPDVVRRYRAGKLAQKDVDTNGDGQADRWEYYDAEKLDRVGLDLDFDGKVDRWSK